MWPVDGIFVLPGVFTSLCLDTVSARMGVGHFLQLAAAGATPCVTGPPACNSLSDDLRDPTLRVDIFKRLLETRLFSELSHIMVYALYINSRFTFLLTYKSCCFSTATSRLHRSMASVRCKARRWPASSKLRFSNSDFDVRAESLPKLNCYDTISEFFIFVVLPVYLQFLLFVCLYANKRVHKQSSKVPTLPPNCGSGHFSDLLIGKKKIRFFDFGYSVLDETRHTTSKSDVKRSSGLLAR